MISNPEIVYYIGHHHNPPYRPQLPKATIELHDQRIVDCITECWDDEPIKRPTFTAVKKKLRAMTKGK